MVRNPWDRLVSAYLNMFITPHNLRQSTSPGRYVVREFYAEKKLDPDFDKAITFRDFVEYVSIREDEKLDGHWQPQCVFLNGNSFDYIGKFEKMDEAFGIIQDSLNIKTELPWANKSSQHGQKTRIVLPQGSCSDLNRAELRQLKSFPKYGSFYTSDLVEMVGNRYREDVDKFSYDF